MTQPFKGDAVELKYEAAGQRATDKTTSDLVDYYNGCYTAADFLLALYDAGRMPYANSVPRDSFVAFIQQAIPNFPNTGSFESYLLVLRGLFGEGVQVLFSVPNPGKLAIVINASGGGIDREWISTEFTSGGAEIDSTMYTVDGEQILFSVLSGIQSQGQLTVLLSEMIPGGISPTITLTFFLISRFVADYDGTGIPLYTVLDSFGNEIVFYET